MSRDNTSQVQFWIEGPSSSENNERNTGATAQFLSYNVLLGLSVLGGYLALDHLYLRSPLTFLAKLVVNVLCFGVWWLYDALNIVFNGDVVKVYGLGVPGLGPRGIGAGVLSNDTPSSIHMNFFIYAIALIFGGLIGLDSFLVGDKRSGIIRLVSTITVLFMPLALLWWGYNIIRFFFSTETVVNENSSYFGSPFQSLASQYASKYPLIGMLTNPVSTAQFVVNKIVGGPIITAVSGLKNSVNSVVGVADKALDTVGNVVKFGQESLTKADEITKTLTAAGTILPSVSLYGETQKLKGAQAGGSLIEKNLIQPISEKDSSLNLLPYTLLGTICFIALGGFIVTIYRSKDVRSTKQSREKDDTPPQPGVFRESDSEKPTSTS